MRADAEYFSSIIWDKRYKELVDAKALYQACMVIPDLLKTELKEYEINYRKALVLCISIVLLRKAAIKKGIVLDRKAIVTVLDNWRGENHEF